MDKLVIYDSADIDTVFYDIHFARCFSKKMANIIKNPITPDSMNSLKSELVKVRKLLRDAHSAMKSPPTPTVIQANHFLDEQFNHGICHGCGKKIK